jgi:hypothetical protein
MHAYAVHATICSLDRHFHGRACILHGYALGIPVVPQGKP